MSSSKENLTEGEAANYLRTTTRTLRNLRRQSQGPAYVRVGRKVIYRLIDLQKWQVVRSTRTQRTPVQRGERS
jgi:hypothetical protein